MSSVKKKNLTGTLFIIATALAVLLVIYLRKASDGTFTYQPSSYQSEEDLTRGEEQLDAAELDDLSSDERALEADLNF